MQRSSSSKPKPKATEEQPFDLSGLPDNAVHEIFKRVTHDTTGAKKLDLAFALGRRTNVDAVLAPTDVELGVQEGSSVKWLQVIPTKDNAARALKALKDGVKYVVIYNEWVKLMVDTRNDANWKAYVYSKNVPHVQLNINIDRSAKVPTITKVACLHAQVLLMPAWRGSMLGAMHGPLLAELTQGARWLRDFLMPTGVVLPTATADGNPNTRLPFKPAYVLVLLSAVSSLFDVASTKKRSGTSKKSKGSEAGAPAHASSK